MCSDASGELRRVALCAVAPSHQSVVPIECASIEAITWQNGFRHLDFCARIAYWRGFARIVTSSELPVTMRDWRRPVTVHAHSSALPARWAARADDLLQLR